MLDNTALVRLAPRPRSVDRKLALDLGEEIESGMVRELEKQDRAISGLLGHEIGMVQRLP